jgi:hypothetical protein
MSSRRYHGELTAKQPAEQAEAAPLDANWLDDKTTSQYARVQTQPTPQTQKALVRNAVPAATLVRANKPDWHSTGPQPRAALTPTVHTYRGSVQQRADSEVAQFWEQQDDSQRAKITGRALEPRWLRALAVVVGSLMCGVFARVLLTTPAALQLPASVSAAPTPAPAPAPAPVEPTPAVVAEPLQPEAAAPPSAAKSSASGSGTRERAKRSKATATAPRSKALAKASPAAEVEPAASEPVQPATLRINSRPWSEVFIDGAAMGNTPQLAIQLTPGEHRVRLHNPQLAATKIFTLRVRPGEVVERIEQLNP